MGMETSDWTREQAEKEVADSVRKALGRVLDLAKAENIATSEAE